MTPNDNSANDQEKETFSVRKPTSNSSREIRDAILREHFGYTDHDILLLDQSDPLFFTVKEKGAKDSWASVQQVMKWKPDANGDILIPLTKTLIRNLREFRSRMMTVQIYYAVGLITDGEIRKNVTEYLTALLNPLNTDRTFVIYNLLTATKGNLKNAEEISSALTHLTDKSGYRDNAFLALAKANAAMTISRMKSGPGYDTNVQVLLAEVTRITARSFNNASNKNASSITREEARLISSHTSFLHSESGDSKTARERDWLARFYSITDEERSEVSEGDIIEFTSSVVTVGTPRPNTDAESKLEELKKAREHTIIRQKEIDKIGSQVIPTDHRTSELYQKKTDGFETQASRKKKIRAGQKGYKGQFKIVTYSEMPYQKANVYADGYGAALDLFNKSIKYGVTLRRLYEITDYLNKKEKLEKQIRSENKYIVPPKPETVQILVKQVQRYGKITVNPSAKKQA